LEVVTLITTRATTKRENGVACEASFNVGQFSFPSDVAVYQHYTLIFSLFFREGAKAADERQAGLLPLLSYPWNIIRITPF
jgi:hypothetical protein